MITAIAETKRLQREQQDEITRQDRERREQGARKLADEILAVNAQIDATMIQLRQLFERRNELVRQLGGTGMLTSTLVLRLSQKVGATSAARAARLHDFLSIEPVLPQQVASLVENNGVLSGQLSTIAD